MGTHIVRVDSALWERLQAVAEAEHRPIAQWVRLVLEDKLAALEQPGGMVPAGTMARQRQVQTNFKK